MEQLQDLAIPGWEAREREISYVGHGQSFDAWKLSDADGVLPPLIARVARRRDMPKPVDLEIAALRELDGTGLAPKLYLVDDSPEAAIGDLLIVTSFEPGAVKAPEEWTFAEVCAVIDRAAQLHAATAREGTSSGVGWLDGSLEYWRETAPETLATEPLASLVSAVDAFVREREGAFDRLTEVVLVHGDLVASNVLLEEGEPRFVDWEWAEVDDVARDLALIGGTVYGGEWYVPLTEEQGAELVTRYAAARGLTLSERADLATRRDVWIAMDRLFSSIHYALNGTPAQRWAAAHMQDTLSHLLGVSFASPST